MVFITDVSGSCRISISYRFYMHHINHTLVTIFDYFPPDKSISK